MSGRQQQGPVVFAVDAAFSRAFSREFGLPQARYRKQRESRQSALAA
jgi:AraC-like DNA-binding protein